MEEKMNSNYEIRKLNEEETAVASDLADLVYPKELYESLESFKNKREFYPDGFLGLYVNRKFSGYIICHPWKLNKEVPLNYLLKEEDWGEIFYLHDLVIAEEQRGKGYGSKMFKRAIEQGLKEGFGSFMLVAVNEMAKKMAEKLGFVVEEKMLYNGIDAWRMSK